MANPVSLDRIPSEKGMKLAELGQLEEQLEPEVDVFRSTPACHGGLE
jgi:hypothetical protein